MTFSTIKKSMIVGTVMAQATLSMAGAMEEYMSSPLTKLPKELLVECLSYACKGGLNLQTVATLKLVNKEWADLSHQSIEVLDLIEVSRTSKHRHYTLMANLICDFPFTQYPNLKTISLDFHFEVVGLLELSEKLQFPKKRNFTACLLPNSIDQKLNAVDAELNDFYSQIHMLFYKTPVLGVGLRQMNMMQLKSKMDTLKKVEADKQKRDTALTNYPINIKRKEKILYSMTSNLQQNRGTADWILAEKSMISYISGFQNIRNLTLVAWDQANLSFITHMPQLKILTLTGHPGHVLDPRSFIYLDGLGQMEKPHGLEELTLAGRLHLTSFEGWSKFEHLKKLSLPLKFFEGVGEKQDDQQQINETDTIHELLHSLVINLPGLESLEISYRLDPYINISQWAESLSQLKSLTFSHSVINDVDLGEMASGLPNIRELHLNHIVDSQWEFWRAHKHTDLRRYIRVLLQEDIELCEKYTQEGLDFFKEQRPEINISVNDNEK